MLTGATVGGKLVLVGDGESMDLVDVVGEGGSADEGTSGLSTTGNVLKRSGATAVMVTGASRRGGIVTEGSTGATGATGSISSVKAWGSGSNVLSTLGFVSPVVTVIVSQNQSALVVASKTFGSNLTNGGESLNLGVCYQSDSGGTISPIETNGTISKSSARHSYWCSLSSVLDAVSSP